MQLIPGESRSAGFGAGLSPAKFELRADQGDTLRDTLTIFNPSDLPADYAFKTADWRLNEAKAVEFIESTLKPNSCRPWVKLERQNVRIRSGGQKKYRFEVHVPEDAATGLCTFAIIIEPGKETLATIDGDAKIKFPVVGRYAAIVYLTVGDATANIDFRGITKAKVGAMWLPVLSLYNAGNTYDRTYGDITATDPNGKKRLLTASDFPLLPGHTENILLTPERLDDSQPPVPLLYPLRLKGRFEIGGKTFKIDETLN